MRIVVGALPDLLEIPEMKKTQPGTLRQRSLRRFQRRTRSRKMANRLRPLQSKD